MKKITGQFLFLCLILFAFYTSSYSQNKTTFAEIKGTVVDKSSGNALESATIQLFKAEDSSLVSGASSDKSGNFIIKDIPEGHYTLRVSYMGYATAVARNVIAGADKKEINFGTIKLEENTEMSQEINVEAEAPQMTMEDGKKIYDVKKDMTVQNGNVLDMLKNVPSVSVDNDGNVSLRGSSNVKILIDGKPSALLSNGTQVLQNIPASSIEKVEIINNPSAKYEAEGVSGIINLIMKQNLNTTGYNGNLKLNGGTEDKYNFSTGGSMKKGNLNMNGSYSYWNYFLPGSTNINRTSFSSIESRIATNDFTWRYKGISHYGSFGMDYDFDKLNNLSLVSNIFFYNRNILLKNNLNFFDNNNNPTNSFRSNNNDQKDGYNFDVTMTYTKKFQQKEREFTAFLNYSKRYENAPLNYANFDSTNTPNFTQKNSYYNFNFINGQADYTHPFSENSKLETGIKSNVRFIKGQLSYSFQDRNSGIWLPLPGNDNDADYKDIVSAAYVTFSNKYKDFSYQGGLRAEHTYLDFSILLGTQKFNNNYIDFFPSLNLTQKIGKENQMQLTYSRRINRPNLFFLNPFVEQFDEFTKRSGNPYLNPEYVHSVELGYTRYLSFASISLSGYYRNVNNVINFISNVDTNGVSLSKPENSGKSNTYGMEFLYQGGFAKWWSFNLSADYFSTNIFDNSIISGFDKTYNGWSGRVTSNASIPDIIDFQLSYFYSGKQITAQGDIQPFQMVNLALSKSFFDKKLVFGFRVNDLLNQMKFSLQSTGNDFALAMSQKSNSRAAFLTVTFNFGENSNSISKKTSQRKQREVETEIQQTGN